MERISVRTFAAAARHIREPVVIVYTYPKNDPRYGEEVEIGVFTPQRTEQTDAEEGPRNP